MRDRPMDQRCYEGRGERFGLVPNGREKLGNLLQGHDQWNQYAGESGPEAYLIWESSYERIFQVNDITDINKSCYAIDHCKGYDNTWWDYAKNFRNALNNGKPPS
ncbi:hypothetical protein BC332_24006 [Capsicum chinense]|nr:hypothetical protein BC332_24006 [Capsicum chinense]